MSMTASRRCPNATPAAAFFEMYGKAQALTSLPLDLVQLEKIEPEFAELIRNKGVLVYDSIATDR